MSKNSGSKQSHSQANHQANQANPNKGTTGNNVSNGHVHGNRGKQIANNK